MRGAPLLAGLAAALAALGSPVAAADMTLGAATRTALAGCDAPTPVRAPDGAVYSNVSDCAPPGSGRISTGWVRLEPTARFVSSSLTTQGNGPQGFKLSGALVEGGVLYVLERNVSGGTRLGRAPQPAKPVVSWTGTLGFGWASFAQASPDGYEYAYMPDATSAYGKADRVDVARVPKGRVADLSAWEIWGGSWLPWASRGSRVPVVTDPGHVWRPNVTRLGGCWAMAVTMPAPQGSRGGSGLAVYTSANPEGPWKRRYYKTGLDLGESAQFSPLWPGKILLTRGDRFEWRGYSMPPGC